MTFLFANNERSCWVRLLRKNNFAFREIANKPLTRTFFCIIYLDKWFRIRNLLDRKKTKGNTVERKRSWNKGKVTRQFFFFFKKQKSQDYFDIAIADIP